MIETTYDSRQIRMSPGNRVRISRTSILVFGIGLAVLFGYTQHSTGQMINTTTPFNSVSDSFFENHGVSFGFSLPGGTGNGSRVVGLSPFGITPNLNFSQGTALGGTPTFGGFNPANAGTFGFSNRGRNGGGFDLGISLSKGSERQSFTTAPTLTTQNGLGGGLSSGSVRPFVTGIVPIVGQRGAPLLPMSQPVQVVDNAVTRALGSGKLQLGNAPPTNHEPVGGPLNYSNPGSSATTTDASVTEIKAARQRKLDAERSRVEAIVLAGKALKDEGKFVEARMKLKEALGETDDKAIKSQIQALIKSCSKR